MSHCPLSSYVYLVFCFDFCTLDPKAASRWHSGKHLCALPSSNVYSLLKQSRKLIPCSTWQFYQSISKAFYFLWVYRIIVGWLLWNADVAMNDVLSNYWNQLTKHQYFENMFIRKISLWTLEINSRIQKLICAFQLILLNAVLTPYLDTISYVFLTLYSKSAYHNSFVI